jgi:hypothetical protein
VAGGQTRRDAGEAPEVPGMRPVRRRPSSVSAAGSVRMQAVPSWLRTLWTRAATSRASAKAVRPLPAAPRARRARGPRGVGAGPVLQQGGGPDEGPGHRRGLGGPRPPDGAPAGCVRPRMESETTCPTPAAAASRAGTRSRRTHNSWAGRSRNIRSAPAKLADQGRADPCRIHGSDPDRRAGGGSSCTSGCRRCRGRR